MATKATTYPHKKPAKAKKLNADVQNLISDELMVRAQLQAAHDFAEGAEEDSSTSAKTAQRRRREDYMKPKKPLKPIPEHLNYPKKELPQIGIVEPTASVGDDVVLSLDARIKDQAQVYGEAKILGSASVSGQAKVYDEAEVSGAAMVYDNAEVFGNATVHGKATINGKAKISGRATVSHDAVISDNAQVYGNAYIIGKAFIGGNAIITGGTWNGSEGPILHGKWNSVDAKEKAEFEIEKDKKRMSGNLPYLLGEIGKDILGIPDDPRAHVKKKSSVRISASELGGEVEEGASIRILASEVAGFEIIAAKEDRVEALKARFPNVDLEAIANIDPTFNGAYMTWLAARANAGDDIFNTDLSNELLSFERLLKSKILKGPDANITAMTVPQFLAVVEKGEDAELEKAHDKQEAAERSLAEKKKRMEEEAKAAAERRRQERIEQGLPPDEEEEKSEEAQVVFSREEQIARLPEDRKKATSGTMPRGTIDGFTFTEVFTHEAMKRLGDMYAPGQWCVAGEGGSYWRDYMESNTKGPNPRMFLVLDNSFSAEEGVSLTTKARLLYATDLKSELKDEKDRILSAKDRLPLLNAAKKINLIPENASADYRDYNMNGGGAAQQASAERVAIKGIENPKLLELLASHPAAQMKMLVAENNNTPPKILDRFARNPDTDISNVALENSGLPKATLNELTRKYRDVQNFNCTSQEFKAVVLPLLKNKQTPRPLIKRIYAKVKSDYGVTSDVLDIGQYSKYISDKLKVGESSALSPEVNKKIFENVTKLKALTSDEVYAALIGRRPSAEAAIEKEVVSIKKVYVLTSVLFPEAYPGHTNNDDLGVNIARIFKVRNLEVPEGSGSEKDAKLAAMKTGSFLANVYEGFKPIIDPLVRSEYEKSYQGLEVGAALTSSVCDVREILPEIMGQEPKTVKQLLSAWVKLEKDTPILYTQQIYYDISTTLKVVYEAEDQLKRNRENPNEFNVEALNVAAEVTGLVRSCYAALALAVITLEDYVKFLRGKVSYANANELPKLREVFTKTFKVVVDPLFTQVYDNLVAIKQVCEKSGYAGNFSLDYSSGVRITDILSTLALIIKDALERTQSSGLDGTLVSNFVQILNTFPYTSYYDQRGIMAYANLDHHMARSFKPVKQRLAKEKEEIREKLDDPFEDPRDKKQYSVVSDKIDDTILKFDTIEGLSTSQTSQADRKAVLERLVKNQFNTKLRSYPIIDDSNITSVTGVMYEIVSKLNTFFTNLNSPDLFDLFNDDELGEDARITYRLKNLSIKLKPDDLYTIGELFGEEVGNAILNKLSLPSATETTLDEFLNDPSQKELAGVDTSELVDHIEEILNELYQSWSQSTIMPKFIEAHVTSADPNIAADSATQREAMNLWLKGLRASYEKMANGRIGKLLAKEPGYSGGGDPDAKTYATKLEELNDRITELTEPYKQEELVKADESETLQLSLSDRVAKFSNKINTFATERDLTNLKEPDIKEFIDLIEHKSELDDNSRLTLAEMTRDASDIVFLNTDATVFDGLKANKALKSLMPFLVSTKVPDLDSIVTSAFESNVSLTVARFRERRAFKLLELSPFLTEDDVKKLISILHEAPLSHGESSYLTNMEKYRDFVRRSSYRVANPYVPLLRLCEHPAVPSDLRYKILNGLFGLPIPQPQQPVTVTAMKRFARLLGFKEGFRLRVSAYA